MTDRTEDFFEKAGGSAFPFVAEGGSDSGLNPELQPGMTLRDYFAAKVVSTAWMDAPSASKWDLDDLFGKERTGLRREEIAAALSYRIADAMLQRRKS